MARQAVDLRKHHPPRHVGHATHELAVDEVAEASGGEAQRTQRRHEIGDVEPALAPHCARRTRAPRGRRGSRRGSSCRPPRPGRSRADAPSSTAACRTARSPGGRRGSRRTRRRTACRRRRADASRSASSAARGTLPSTTNSTKPARYMSPYQRTATGPSWKATGSNCGMDEHATGVTAALESGRLYKPQLHCAVSAAAAQDFRWRPIAARSSSRKASPARPIAPCCAPSASATAISRSRSWAWPTATAR